ncbi:PREDICTED: uncharacterized protein LOC108759425 [Trachymyrmex cornetzi]|uniref:uncharacterized protein LOC108759425 n=1 Tax=Trachymyrmex cornetzi TaxID=471704 RepID=UPI00084F6676|nr:PREDICTED: uncharacterized protein LOC108759425 [Trachymyrmex cornetzi]
MDKENVFDKPVKDYEITLLYNTNTKTSFAWQNFGTLILKDGDKKVAIMQSKVFCLSCLKTAQKTSESEENEEPFSSFVIKSYSNTISTGNLIRHLADSHNIREDRRKVTEHKLTNFFTIRPKNPFRKESDKKWLFGRHLVLMACRDLLPFTIVENEGFRDFLRKYNVIKDGTDLPARMTLSRTALEDVFVSMKEHIMDKYTNCAINDYCFTFDMWTDNYRHRNYICFTLHFIDNDFNLKSITLGNKLVVGKHTAENIVFHLDTIKDEFTLSNKKYFIVTDSGANMKKVAKISNNENHLCSGHGLHNLVIVDGVKKNIIYKFSDLEKEIDIVQQKVLLLVDNASEYLEMEDNDPLFLDLDEFNLNDLGLLGKQGI